VPVRLAAAPAHLKVVQMLAEVRFQVVLPDPALLVCRLRQMDQGRQQVLGPLGSETQLPAPILVPLRSWPLLASLSPVALSGQKDPACSFPVPTSPPQGHYRYAAKLNAGAFTGAVNHGCFSLECRLQAIAAQARASSYLRPAITGCSEGCEDRPKWSKTVVFGPAHRVAMSGCLHSHPAFISILMLTDIWAHQPTASLGGPLVVQCTNMRCS
jgi:hypothetical protein